MNTIIDLMLAIREKCTIFYHKDTKQFDYFPFSEFERREVALDKLIPVSSAVEYLVMWQRLVISTV